MGVTVANASIAVVFAVLGSLRLKHYLDTGNPNDRRDAVLFIIGAAVILMCAALLHSIPQPTLPDALDNARFLFAIVGIAMLAIFIWGLVRHLLRMRSTSA